MILQKGDHVKIQFSGQLLEGSVILASENGRSLALAFEGIMGGYVAMMPVLLEEDGIFRDLVTGREVEIEKI